VPSDTIWKFAAKRYRILVAAGTGGGRISARRFKPMNWHDF
jgi:hypothetical protein